MEFHGTARVSEISALQVSWNSMELLVSAKLAHSKSWNSGWINFRKLISTQYIFVSLLQQLIFSFNICLIPCAFQALLITEQNIIQNIFSMLIETYFDQKVAWSFLQSSKELFEHHLKQHIPKLHGIPWNFVQIQRSMDFRGTYSILPKSIEFHGIPWNFQFSRKSSMEFHGTFWGSMELDSSSSNFISNRVQTMYDSIHE